MDRYKIFNDLVEWAQAIPLPKSARTATCSDDLVLTVKINGMIVGEFDLHKDEGYVEISCQSEENMVNAST